MLRAAFSIIAVLVARAASTQGLARCEASPGMVYGNGKNMGQFTTATAEACCERCYATRGCVAYGWHSNATVHPFKCWLHRAATPVVQKDGVVGGRCSGPAPPPTPPPAACTGKHAHYPFCDEGLGLNARIADLVSRINDTDKPGLLTARAQQSLDYIGVPSYYWGTNCIQSVEAGAHGESAMRCVGQRCPTHFPSPPGWASTFNRSAMDAMARVMQVELRALFNVQAAKGLDCWGPVMNLNRDPRWGRNGEAGPECPYMMAEYALAWTRAFEGTNRSGASGSLPAIVTLKHFDANSLERWGNYTRHNFDANVSNYMLSDTYLPHFRRAIKEGGAHGVMCSYNSVQGIPTCLSPLMRNARKAWGFDGYVTSDSDSVADAYKVHKFVATAEEASCRAVTDGACDINSGNTYANSLLSGVQKGLCSLKDIDAAVARTLKVRFLLGLFDNAGSHPLARLGPEDIGTPASQALSLDVTRQSLVLLENNNSTLPWTRGKSLAVLGPHGNASSDLMGNHYKGYACPGDSNDCIVTPLEGFTAANRGGTTTYAPGCGINEQIKGGVEAAVEMAKGSDAVVLMLGINRGVASENHDRTSIDLPAPQHELAGAILALGKPTTIFLVSGGMLAVEQEMGHADTAIVQAFYPGRYAGTALAETVFGDNNPAGKMPYTVYPAGFVDEVPMTKMDISTGVGATYRYYTGRTLFPFGHGLSFTTFDLSGPAGVDLTADTASTATSNVTVTLKNVGTAGGHETIMAFYEPIGAATPLRRQMFDFQKVGLAVGESTQLTFSFSPVTFQMANPSNGDLVVFAGTYRLTFTDGVGQTVVATLNLNGKDVLVEPFPSKHAAV